MALLDLEHARALAELRVEPQQIEPPVASEAVPLLQEESVQVLLQSVSKVGAIWHVSERTGAHASVGGRRVREERLSASLPIDHVESPILVDPDGVDLPRGHHHA